jgi:hypothetical protein
LHLYYAPSQEHTNHASNKQPTNQTLPTINEGPEYPGFRKIPEVQLHQPNHPSTSTSGPSQTTEGAQRQSPPRAPSPAHMLSEDAELGQVQIDDWDQEAKEEEAAAEEEELARVRQEIERLRHELQ